MGLRLKIAGNFVASNLHSTHGLVVCLSVLTESTGDLKSQTGGPTIKNFIGVLSLCSYVGDTRWRG